MVCGCVGLSMLLPLPGVTFIGGASGMDGRSDGSPAGAGVSSVSALLVSGAPLRSCVLSSFGAPPTLNRLPPIWIRPMTMATMLAAMSSDLIRFEIDARNVGRSWASMSVASRRGARVGVAVSIAAWAARRAAAIKPDLPAGPFGCGRALPSAASDAAMRAAGLA
jgi:hypothetical protein